MLGRLCLGLFVFAWAGASAQPCLMAMDASADTPMAAEHASHGGHHSSGVESPDTDDCGHCPPGGHEAVSCASGVSAECGDQQDVNTETRTAPQKLKDAQGTTGLTGPDPGPVGPQSVSLPRPAQFRQLKYRTTPSLSILNCVFLK
jgi:hypothetical protein